MCATKMVDSTRMSRNAFHYLNLDKGWYVWLLDCSASVHEADLDLTLLRLTTMVTPITVDGTCARHCTCTTHTPTNGNSLWSFFMFVFAPGFLV